MEQLSASLRIEVTSIVFVELAVACAVEGPAVPLSGELLADPALVLPAFGEVEADAAEVELGVPVTSTCLFTFSLS